MNSFRLIVVLFCLVFLLQAQQQSAPSGYYPDRYRGDMFVGAVQSVNKDTQELTLVANDKDGAERSFSGRLAAPCDVPSKEKGRKLKVEDIPAESVVSAFYMAETEKRDGAKVKVNSVFAISFLKFGSQTMSKPVVFRCSTEPFRFKCFEPGARACLAQ